MNSWEQLFDSLKDKKYYQELMDFINYEYEHNVCYPAKDKLFNAFKLTPLKDVKVVIIGQDPYHEPNQAMGLAFSVINGIKIPPSLKNIYKEIELEYNSIMNYSDTDLTYLAKQGVLLINSILSVREHSPMSHNIPQYKMLLEDILSCLNNCDFPIVFMLWGGPSKSLKKHITNPKHLILEANHPSPLSANRGGWFGCDHFKKANNFLSNNGKEEINWSNFCC